HGRRCAERITAGAPRPKDHVAHRRFTSRHRVLDGGLKSDACATIKFDEAKATQERGPSPVARIPRTEPRPSNARRAAREARTMPVLPSFSLFARIFDDGVPVRATLTAGC